MVKKQWERVPEKIAATYHVGAGNYLNDEMIASVDDYLSRATYDSYTESCRRRKEEKAMHAAKEAKNGTSYRNA